MTTDIQRLINSFDTAAQEHGWASDCGTLKQAQTALRNYQQARTDLETAITAQAKEIERLRFALEDIAFGRVVSAKASTYADLALGKKPELPD